jgi:prolyl oligopeptidase
MRFAICGAAILYSSAMLSAAENRPDDLAAIGIDASLPVPPIRPVTESLWGTKVTDAYRYMEALDPGTLDWIKKQGDYTNAVFAAIAPRAALARRIAQFTSSFGIAKWFVSYGGRSFYLERVPGSDNFDLMERDLTGAHKLVDIAALRTAQGGRSAAINYFLVSPDGTKIALGISSGGSEDASLTVLDVATQATVAGPLDRCEYATSAWSDDSSTLYFVRLKKLTPGEGETEKYKYLTLYRWDLHGEPQPLLGSSVGHGPRFSPLDFPGLQISPGGTLAMAGNTNGVERELVSWLAPVAEIGNPQIVWKPFTVRADEVTGVEMRGDEIFLLSHKNAPTYRVLAVRAGQPFASAKTLLAAQKDMVIDSIHAASDALYVVGRHGAYSKLLRIPAGDRKAVEIELPFKGHISEAFSDPRAPGLSLSLESWVLPPSEFKYDAGSGKFIDLALTSKPAIDPTKFVVQELQARSHDGIMVPLSLIQPKGIAGPQITYLYAYGFYGSSRLASFNLRTVGFLREGGSYATCHVRGGGELGEAWRLAGKDANKPNTWRDLIACGEDLIARGVTSKDKLFIQGASGGGITVGMAMTERPDLFAGVIAGVPAVNTLRAEFAPNGPPNISEFGTVTSESGFKNLYAMDTLQHIKAGRRYPAILITVGLNDARVAPWQPAKLAAMLQASGTRNPVLLRVDADAGHGVVGSNKTQSDEENADIYSFIFWRAGLADWRPRKTHP